jgi:hypothetical protein
MGEAAHGGRDRRRGVGLSNRNLQETKSPAEAGDFESRMGDILYACLLTEGHGCAPFFSLQAKNSLLNVATSVVSVKSLLSDN